MHHMRLRDGRYECAHCGDALDTPFILDPLPVMRSANGVPNGRALLVDGKELHACVMGERDAQQSEGARSRS